MVFGGWASKYSEQNSGRQCMLKNIFFSLVLVIISSLANSSQAIENCVTVEANLNLNIPCIAYQGQNYQIQLNAVAQNNADFPYCWQLDKDIQMSEPSNNCASIAENLNLHLACLNYAEQNYAVVMANMPAGNGQPCQWTLAGVSSYMEPSVTKPVLYIVSMMHAEDNVPFHENAHLFSDFATNLRRVSDLLSSHGAKLDFGPDWTFLQGVIRHDQVLLTDLLAAGHNLHTHAHSTSFDANGRLYDLGVVNGLLAQAGVPANKIANGGFNKIGPDGKNWVAYVANFKDAQGGQLFDGIIGYKDSRTQIPDSLGYMIAPSINSASENWRSEDPNSSMLYIGSNMPPFAGAGKLDFATIRSWLDKKLTLLQAGKINTLYWHDSLHNYSTEELTTQRLAEWEQFLVEYLDEKVASGEIQWKTFTEMLDLYKGQQQ
jgi:hypothetical protein